MAKKRILLAAGIILALVALVTVGIAIYLNHLRGQIMDGPGMVREPELKYLYYCRNGGSRGDYYRAELTGKALTITRCEDAGAPATEQQYPVDEEIYFELDDIIYQYGMRKWTDLPPTEAVALDGPVTTLELKFSDGESLYISSTMELSEDAHDAIGSILTRLQEETGTRE